MERESAPVVVLDVERAVAPEELPDLREREPATVLENVH
jgi:hypothetical protein